jgi:hypothetical protein
LNAALEWIMKSKLLLALAMLAAAPFARAADIGVSIAISQPGVYGRIDIGRFPQPAVILPQPVIITPQPVVLAPQPVYLWVPPGHRKNWAKHCGRYGACGVPVYFVRHDWYERNIRYAAVSHRGNDDRGQGHGRGRGKGKGRD